MWLAVPIRSFSFLCLHIEESLTFRKKEEEEMKLTQQHFRQAISSNGGFSLRQLKVLGFYKFEHGWKERAMKRDYEPEVIERFIALKDKHKMKFKKPALPTLPLDEAITRLGDDEVWKKVSKGFRWKED